MFTFVLLNSTSFAYCCAALKKTRTVKASMRLGKEASSEGECEVFEGVCGKQHVGLIVDGGKLTHAHIGQLADTC